MKMEIWDLAHQVARSQLRLRQLEGIKAPTEVIQGEIQLLQERIDLVLNRTDNEVILAALPVAEHYVARENKRKRAFDGGLIGTFSNLLDNWGAALEDGNQEPPGTSFAESQGLEGDALKMWATLEKAITSGTPLEIVEAIRNLVGTIRGQLIYADLPPAPKLPKDLGS